MWIQKNVETCIASNGIVDLRGYLSSARWPVSLDLREIIQNGEYRGVHALTVAPKFASYLTKLRDMKFI
jgi:hypothetical protein